MKLQYNEMKYINWQMRRELSPDKAVIKINKLTRDFWSSKLK